MNVEVNWWAVILATASSMVVGSIWYARSVFGNVWIKLTNIDEKKMGQGVAKSMVITIVASFLTAYVLAHVSFLSHKFFGNSFIWDAMSTAFWLWLGLTAARLVVHDVFEHRPTALTVLNVAHEFVTLMVMGAVIGWLGV